MAAETGRFLTLEEEEGKEMWSSHSVLLSSPLAFPVHARYEPKYHPLPCLAKASIRQLCTVLPLWAASRLAEGSICMREAGAMRREDEKANMVEEKKEGEQTIVTQAMEFPRSTCAFVWHSWLGTQLSQCLRSYRHISQTNRQYVLPSQQLCFHQ